MNNVRYSKVAKDICFPDKDIDEVLSLHQQGLECTGKTTGEIFSLIGYCMTHPEEVVPLDRFITHPKSEHFNRAGGVQEHLLEIVMKNRIQFMEIKYRQNALVYKPWGYLKKGWVEATKDGIDEE